MNAKKEFLEEIKDKQVVCAKIGKECDYQDYHWNILKEGYTQEEFDTFCNSLDFEYDSGYGGQELFGVILFEDGYSERHEYDGSECWEYKKIPSVKEVLEFEPD